MIPGIETQFVNRYIVKNRRERILFELDSKRRDDCIHRFAHRANEHLIPSCMHPYTLDSKEKLYKDMLALGCSPTGAHIVSISNNQENFMSLWDAISEGVYMGTVIIIASDAFAAYYESEPDYASEKYLIY